MQFRWSKCLNRLSLQTVLIVPFVVQVIAVVGVVGYLSFKNGQSAVNNLASQLRRELTARILQQLQATVERPHVINQINANSLLQNDLNILTGQGEYQLWQQAKVFPSTNLIYCGSEEDGAFLGVGRSDGGIGDALIVQTSNASTDYYFRYYDIDPTGRRGLLRSKGNRRYDPRSRPWYRAAEAIGKPTWSEVYLDFDVMLPTITAAIPVYNRENGQLSAVCATDIILSEELNHFLRNLEIGQSGIAFIAEPDSSLIASSTIEPITLGRGENTELLPGNQSSNPLIRAATHYLSDRFGGFSNISTTQATFMLEDKRQFLEVVRFNDGHGLDWIVVLVIPESDFMEQIHENTRMTLLSCVVALLVAILIGLITTQWLTRPLLQLNTTAKEIAQGKWEKVVELERTDEIGELSRAFASMVYQLRAAFTNLEERVEERTTELIRLNQELHRLAQVDGLTQIANRRQFDVYLDKEWQRSIREQQPLTLILCDVDYFKRYNDTYGHQAGDRCLQKIAHMLTQTVKRPADLVARYGGEEFAIILPNTDENGAIYVAHKIQMALQALQIPHQSSEKGYITISMGMATMTPITGEIYQSLILSADRALYLAKAEGRDQFCIGKHEEG
ncbi:diguanylate cyclase [Oscillatoria sp. FACHB-1407]|uniref:diguanylate cyclase domain-containing protein n=1 Tax=Oscillatoria sp. FACHB-1407 TaxID=2692847 RepID=UPI001683F148|nr:diguanylate cyclase [Oscillatoria sp. FACHB-1407]MBD2463774.1 diguanylate cyclase [Oscillatoria sp. FACHB-1407]